MVLEDDIITSNRYLTAVRDFIHIHRLVAGTGQIRLLIESPNLTQSAPDIDRGRTCHAPQAWWCERTAGARLRMKREADYVSLK